MVRPPQPSSRVDEPGGCLLVLGDQLLSRHPSAAETVLIERRDLATRHRYHQARVVHCLAAMRHHARALGARRKVRYVRMDDEPDESFAAVLAEVLRRGGHRQLTAYAPADGFMRAVIGEAAHHARATLSWLETPTFDVTPAQWATYRAAHPRRLHLRDFWIWQRRRHRLLLDAAGEPLGGAWSLDQDNREPLPKKWTPPPEPPPLRDDPAPSEVVALVRRFCADHPGDAATAWLPVSRRDWLVRLDHFCTRLLAQFGPWQDAFGHAHATLHHSVLTPGLNNGLLLPGEVAARVLSEHAARPLPLSSVEGFLRQLLGWREFVAGVHRDHAPEQAAGNAWDHHRRLAATWTTATTGIPPWDDALRKASASGYCHHIERLMVLGNAFFLCEIAPGEVHRWFMEHFVDAAEWVMGPNVYGMSQQSDGGLMTTKPYVCGSAYLRRQGRLGTGAWCDVVDGLYWRFIARHRARLGSNARMQQAVAGYERLAPARRNRILNAAEAFLGAHTTT